MKNIDLMFQERFKKSTPLDNKLVYICNQEGKDAAIKYAKSLGAQTIDFKKQTLIYHINEYTYSNSSKEEIVNALKEIKTYVKEVSLTKNSSNISKLEITTSLGVIKIFILSEIIPGLLNTIPELENKKRTGNCYHLSFNISILLENPHNVVTGYTYGVTDKSEYLHTWIEYKENGIEYVIDGSLNAIINKEAFYFLRKPKVLTSISNQTILDDIKDYFEEINKIPLPFYYLYRDEIIADFKKNKQLFNNQKDKEVKNGK